MKNFNNIIALLIVFSLTTIFVGCEEDNTEPEVQNITFAINHEAGDSEMNFTSEFTLPSGETVSFRRLAYLLSNFYLVKSDDSRIELADQYAFINLGQGNTSFTLENVPMGDYKSVGFDLGLDSAINHGDPNQYEIDHPLSPLNNSLHWNWKGGYIFTALEGKTLENEKSFIFHLAGIQNKLSFELPYSFTKAEPEMKATMKYDVMEIFQNPEVYSIENDGESTHSTTSPSTVKLIGNMSDIFTLVNINE